MTVRGAGDDLMHFLLISIRSTANFKREKIKERLR